MYTPHIFIFFIPTAFRQDSCILIFSLSSYFLLNPFPLNRRPYLCLLIHSSFIRLFISFSFLSSFLPSFVSKFLLLSRCYVTKLTTMNVFVVMLWMSHAVLHFCWLRMSNLQVCSTIFSFEWELLIPFCHSSVENYVFTRQTLPILMNISKCTCFHFQCSTVLHFSHNSRLGIGCPEIVLKLSEHVQLTEVITNT
jgi:hypothetical protein